MLYIDKKGNVYMEKPNNIDVEKMITIREACEKWGVEGSWARRIVSKVEGSRQIIINGRNTWLVPFDAEKPTKTINRDK